MSALDPLFQQFLRDRTYLKNVTPKTQVWYETAWKTYLRSCAEPPTSITRADLQRFIVHLRDRGVQAVSCNSWLRAIERLLPVASRGGPSGGSCEVAAPSTEEEIPSHP